MLRLKSIFGVYFGAIVLFFNILLSSCGEHADKVEEVIFTQVTVQAGSLEILNTIELKYLPGMQIARAEIGESLENVQILTKGFFSARAPEVSYDGKTLVFSGQKTANDIWQIWILNLAKNEIRQVTHAEQNCTDPTWLPDGRIAYSKLINGEKGLKYHGLFSCFDDGNDEAQITFQPHEDLNAGVLHDGRLIISSQQIYPELGDIKLLAVHPDGTKAELFYQPEQGGVSKVWESADKLVFAESMMLTSIRFNRPLHSREVFGPNNEQNYSSIFPIGEQQYISSVKSADEQTYSLNIINLSGPDASILRFNNPAYHAIEPIVVMTRNVPKKLPSTVMTELESGYFICMNADRSDLGLQDTSATKVQILGFDQVLGEVPLQSDGSFYVELGADRPLRFQTLNESGEVVRGPSSWMWLRPNERRGCVGCHEDRELAPPNVIPQAIEKAPFAIIK